MITSLLRCADCFGWKWRRVFNDTSVVERRKSESLVPVIVFFFLHAPWWLHKNPCWNWWTGAWVGQHETTAIVLTTKKNRFIQYEWMWTGAFKLQKEPQVIHKALHKTFCYIIYIILLNLYIDFWSKMITLSEVWELFMDFFLAKKWFQVVSCT